MLETVRGSAAARHTPDFKAFSSAIPLLTKRADLRREVPKQLIPRLAAAGSSSIGRTTVADRLDSYGQRAFVIRQFGRGVIDAKKERPRFVESYGPSQPNRPR